MKLTATLNAIMKANPELSISQAINKMLGREIGPAEPSKEIKGTPTPNEPFEAMTGPQKALIQRLIQQGKITHIDFETTSKKQASRIIGSAMGR